MGPGIEIECRERFGCEIGRLMSDDQISPDYETPTAEEFIAEVRRRTRRHEG